MTELRDGIAAIGLFPTSEELNIFMTRYDDGGDRHLNLREFSEAFLPLDAYLRRHGKSPWIKSHLSCLQT